LALGLTIYISGLLPVVYKSAIRMSVQKARPRRDNGGTGSLQAIATVHIQQPSQQPMNHESRSVLLPTVATSYDPQTSYLVELCDAARDIEHAISELATAMIPLQTLHTRMNTRVDIYGNRCKELRSKISQLERSTPTCVGSKVLLVYNRYMLFIHLIS